MFQRKNFVTEGLPVESMQFSTSNLLYIYNALKQLIIKHKILGDMCLCRKLHNYQLIERHQLWEWLILAKINWNNFTIALK